MQESHRPPSQRQPTMKTDRAGLAQHYGRIGIPAVAAALPYNNCAGNPAKAPATGKPFRGEHDSQD